MKLNWFGVLLVLQCVACEKNQTSSKGVGEAQDQQVSLPWQGDGFGITISDINADGLKDVLGVSHTDGTLSTFLQVSPREFEPLPVYDGVGFHPGNLIEWSKTPGILVEAAEGSEKIKAFRWEADQKNFAKVSESGEQMPRFVSEFTWPGWGASLAAAPFLNGFITLWQGYDPVTGESERRHIVPLSNFKYTLRASERITVADLENDGVPELLLAVSATNQVMVVRYPGKPEDGPMRPLAAEVLYEDVAWGMPNEVQVADLDGDGYSEIMVPDEAAPSRIHILARQPGGKYREIQSWSFPGREGVMEFRMLKESDGHWYGLAAGPGQIAIYQVPDGWSPSAEPIIRGIPWEHPDDFPLDMQLTDLDGDTWPDLLMSRINGKANIWIAYGPLWESFEKLAEQGFKLH